jgi:hypothetical protein
MGFVRVSCQQAKRGLPPPSTAHKTFRMCYIQCRELLVVSVGPIHEQIKQPQDTAMSTKTDVVAEKIRLKFIVREAKKFISLLFGTQAEILFEEESFKSHRSAFLKTCRIDASPEIKFTHPVDKNEIIDYVSNKIKMNPQGLIIPFEPPVFIRLNVNHVQTLVKSMLENAKTLDLVLYSIVPSFVVAIHDGEYEVHCFQQEISDSPSGLSV